MTSADIVEAVAARGLDARAIPDRSECGELLVNEAQPGDRIIIMGARDDTLATFATILLHAIAQRTNDSHLDETEPT